MELLMLHAHRDDFDHHFTEIFSSMEKLEAFLASNTAFVQDFITMHELDPK